MPHSASSDHERARGLSGCGQKVKRHILDRGEWNQFTWMNMLLLHWLPTDDPLMAEAQRCIDEANDDYYMNMDEHSSGEEEDDPLI